MVTHRGLEPCYRRERAVS